MHFQFAYFSSVATYDIIFGVVRYIWWPAGYRGTPKIFVYTGKILQVVSLFLSQHFGQHLLRHKARHKAKCLLSKLINEPEVDFVM